ncbi:hypothetical protein bcere0018_33640 [Bacillus cereus Rock1-15]|uniref:hypothetical protein n=1 Tax=Bacillus cereus TaxID=1396 RepID=UPI0001A07C96|nr:hypothetical protein [Bacillus cereus]EEL27568.1 hypothetical protein bcere0018_33640 [Bacillus cereus Rock1-15]
MGERRGGRIIMTNMNIQKQFTLNLNHIKVNTKVKKGENQDYLYKEKNYHLRLENKLNDLSIMINKKFIDMYKYIVTELKRTSKHSEDMIIEFDRVSDMSTWYKKNGNNKLIALKDEMKTKKITQEDYEYLFSVIEDQEKFAQKLFNQRLSVKRIQSIVNFIGDFILYLEMDMELKKLPDMKDEKTFELVRNELKSNRLVNYYSYQDITYKDIA